ncbi:ABC transporter ATP-binding protein [Seohaeicola zhoushanensis]|uniref:ABC transporter ATP-binding protein n=1 Tax=Seohaeicola zhoushanensis TaxID=1569283 RepID=A0A8J3MAH0_9RHOB|nr:ABC transporter ATP-binding protein [Seohaeicola zhoushanensis]GHF67263.1 ABC transporter ATP-binding protein [Seohaeicola zhoushanensis]
MSTTQQTVPMLEVRGLSTGYGNIPVLHDVSFEVPQGKVTAVIGANGAGKTTLLSTIAGLIPATSGQLMLDGTDISRTPAASRTAAGLALVPEGGRLFPFMTVRENLELGAYSLGRDAGMRQRIAEICEIFPVLAERQSQMAGHLSGGERQMCAVARAMMSRPRLLMLDEPSVGLSPLMTERLLSTISDLAASEALTVVIVEQRVTEVLAMAELAHMLDHGRIMKSGTAGEFRTDRMIQETYMGR